MAAEALDDDMEDVKDGIPMQEQEGIPVQEEEGQHYLILEVIAGSTTILERFCLLRMSRKSSTFMIIKALSLPFLVV